VPGIGLAKKPPRTGRAAAVAGLVLAMLLPALSLRAADVVVRVFSLKYRRAEEAALLVGPLLTESGSVIVQPRLNTLTVRDVAPAVERTAQAIASYDVPPRAVSISIALLKASDEPAAPGAKREVSDEIRGVGERLKKLFKMTSFNRLDSVVVQGTEGDPIAYAIGGEYRLEFVIEGSREEASKETTIRLKDVAFERIRRDEKGKDVRRELLRTSINVTVGQPFILGVGRDEAASGALFLVFDAAFLKRGPGIGVR
jgi:hypothetical protein